jgi:hypothetical protein
MKLYRTLGLAAMFAFPQLTPAASSVPPGALGQVEATVSFCARIDSKSADQYKELGKIIVAGMTDKELAEARDSKEYKEASDLTKGQLEKIPEEKAVETCRAALNNAGK